MRITTKLLRSTVDRHNTRLALYNKTLSTLIKLRDLKLNSRPLINDLESLSCLIKLRQLSIMECPLIFDLGPHVDLETTLKKIRMSKTTGLSQEDFEDATLSSGPAIRKLISRSCS